MVHEGAGHWAPAPSSTSEPTKAGSQDRPQESNLRDVRVAYPLRVARKPDLCVRTYAIP